MPTADVPQEVTEPELPEEVLEFDCAQCGQHVTPKWHDDKNPLHDPYRFWIYDDPNVPEERELITVCSIACNDAWHAAHPHPGLRRLDADTR
jgi:hypothetical protein